MNNVYLMSSINNDTIEWKIGVSKNPQQRFKEHKISNPNLENINAIYEVNNSDIAYFIEARLKNYLQDFNINGEWFVEESLTPELFIAYCDRFLEHANIYFNLKNNLN